MATRLGWITATAARGLDQDEPLALAALRRGGVDVDVVAWDDPHVAWSGYDRAVLRSTWDYPSRLSEFSGWLEHVAAGTELLNPLPMLRWNLDKRYLSDLADAGVPIVATTFVSPGERGDLPAGATVIKPAVGAGARGVATFGPDQGDQAHAHIARLHSHAAGTDPGGTGGDPGTGGDRGTATSRGTVLIQPLLRSVAEHGEWPLIFFGGRYSHAANKRVTLARPGAVDELFAAETTTAHLADAEQTAVARAAVQVVTERFGTPVYARVDLVRDDQGRPCVLELELVEPSLFLSQGGPEALEHLVNVLR